jgi:Cu/Ag efflux protein CusF
MNHGLFGAAILMAALFGSPSCSPEKPPQAKPSAADELTIVNVTPGEAGGEIEDSFTVSCTVSAVDKASRKITLSGDDGTKASFTAGPEVRNFDQLKAGDKVVATFLQRLKVFVRSGSEDPSLSHSAALAAAPKGAKPGVMASEVYEVTASVKSIDPVARKATLAFADGKTRVASVRPDVDLSRYNVGDTVVIRVSLALSLLVEKP